MQTQNKSIDPVRAEQNRQNFAKEQNARSKT
jgi:hypothetical protein